jgi:hypothetical protein
MNYVIAVHSERVEESGEEIVMSFGVSFNWNVPTAVTIQDIQIH